MMLWWGGQNTSERDNTAVIEVLREQIEVVLPPVF